MRVRDENRERKKICENMSRSALWRQEAGVKERERLADDAFLAAVEEGRVSESCTAPNLFKALLAGLVITCNFLAELRLTFSRDLQNLDNSQNCRVRGLIPLHGPDDTFNFNPMLLHNITKSQYFQKSCKKITDWNALVDEIYYEVKHVEPWTPGKFHPGRACVFYFTRFCIIFLLIKECHRFDS